MKTARLGSSGPAEMTPGSRQICSKRTDCADFGLWVVAIVHGSVAASGSHHRFNATFLSALSSSPQPSPSLPQRLLPVYRKHAYEAIELC
jgi:hypothetical protein